VKNNERLAIFKDPKTDSKKKSAKGLLAVVFEDGKLIKETTLAEIRETINQQI
jgi:nicotinamide phosphoribosyltransferase